MNRLVAGVSFLVILVTSLNYAVYILNMKVFSEELYAGIALVLTIVVTLIKRLKSIDGIYKGKKNLKPIAYCFVVFAVILLIISSVATKKTADSAYFWFSYTIMMSGLAFFSFYLGKTVSGVNWFSFGTGAKKRRGKNSKQIEVES